MEMIKCKRIFYPKNDLIIENKLYRKLKIYLLRTFELSVTKNKLLKTTL